MYQVREMPRGRFLGVALLFVIVGLALYSRVIAVGPFIFDDTDYVLENPFIREISTAFFLNDARQVGYLSFALNYALGGDNPVGYHLFNVLVHVANSLLAVLLTLSILRRLNNDETLPAWSAHAALLTGLLFLVHPLQTQAVSYITQRFTSLSTLLYLLAVLSYLSARRLMENRRPGTSGSVALALSLLSTVAAMRTKEIAITIPFMLITLDLLLYRTSRFGARRYLLLLPFVLALAIIPLTIFGPELGISRAVDGRTDDIRYDKIHDLTRRSPLQYFSTQMRVIPEYLRLLFVPVGQRVIYDFPVAERLLEPWALMGFLFLAAIGAGAFYSWKRYRSFPPGAAARLVYGLAAVGTVWFFVTISVESSFLPIKDVIFEHRVYLPSVGFFAVLSIMVAYGTSRLQGPLPRILKVLVPVMLLSLGVTTFMRNEVWTDELRFWNDVVEKAPQKAMGYNNRATVFARREEYDKALEDFNRVISFFPKTTEQLFKWDNADQSPWNMSKSYTGRGNVYLVLGRPDLAEKDYQRAKEVFSMPVDADNLLLEADALSKAGRYPEAVWIYDRILEWDPRDVRALNDRANAYSYMDRLPEAINDLTRVIALEPAFIVAYYNRGLAYALAGKREKAIEDFRQACSKGFEPACRNIDPARWHERSR